ncbi:MAG: hypothetical protein QM809_15790 [Gordonia sp. (in: high G+C Gram-positive bacteria)]|uniref:hypothetical protein n=1 Tax=Gordonia sp. (in: high G+C Gram-positive bacteria) TaxID=84139 RepID=UPI0039E5E3CF
MLQALGFAFFDAINVLLIGVLVALAIMLPPGRYRSIAGLLVIGDWLGVFFLALITLAVFDGFGSLVQSVIDSWIFGVVLILVGVGGAIATFRGGDSTDMIDKVLAPLRSPSPLTMLVGFGLGLIQSVTSVPFFLGLAILSTSDMPTIERYAGLPLFATVALSLPILSALLLGLVRHNPDSWVGRLFQTARSHRDSLTKAAGYVVAVLLVVVGAVRLF